MARLLLIDGGWLSHSSWHRGASDPATTWTEVAYRMVVNRVRTSGAAYLVVAFDSPRLVRKEVLPGYKDRPKREGPNTAELVDDLAPFLEGRGILSVGVDGWEADDVIGTLRARGEAAGSEVWIAGRDIDLGQLVTGDVRWLRSVHPEPEIWGEVEVREKMGVRPEQFPDLIGLVGQRKDRLPRVETTLDGVRKIIRRPKAIELLRRFQTLEGIREAVPYLSDPNVTLVLKPEAWAQAFMVRDLARIRTELELEVDPRLAAVSRIVDPTIQWS